MNNGWIAASIKRKESGNLGSGPLLPWLGLHDDNTEEVLKIIRENRRRQVLIEEARKAAKKKERLKKRRERKLITLKPKSKNNMKYHFSVLPKKKRDNTAKSDNATKHLSKKRFQNDTRRFEKRKKFREQSVKKFLRRPISKIKKILQSLTGSQSENGGQGENIVLDDAVQNCNNNVSQNVCKVKCRLSA